MAADDHRGVLEEARRTFPHTSETAVGMATFTRTRVERIISLSVGIGCLALGAQAFVVSLAPADESAGWHVALSLMVFLPLVAMIAALLAGRGVRLCAGAFAIVYAVALALWPVATVGSQPAPHDGPWIWYLLNVATVAAVLAFPLPLQILWTALVPIEYGLVRMAQAALAEEFWIPVALDVLYAIILGGVLVTLGWMFRSVAQRVDEARMRAVASYAEAAAADAAEQERVAVAALMHDSVLAALIAAERAESPRESALATAMAREALTRLANAEQDVGEGTDEPVQVDILAERLERAAAEFGVVLSVARDIAEDAAPVPGRAGRALVLAGTQALANAIQHADAAGLAVTLAATAADGLRIVVADQGSGFDLDEVPEDRLGIRGSIFARVAAVGGHAEIDSDHRGTVVRLLWKASS